MTKSAKTFFATILILVLGLFIGGLLLAIPGVSERTQVIFFTVYLITIGLFGIIKAFKIF